LLKINCANQLRSVEATYESRLQEISVRLKREELELQRLRNSDKDYMAISAELDKLREMAKQDESNYRSELSNLKRQNNHLEDQIRELIPLCEESISAKNSNNSIKLVVCQLLRHLLFVVSRFKQLEVYTALLKGFWNYYEKVHWTIRTIPKLKGIGQFRKAVLAVLAARRLRKMGQKTNEKGKQIHGVKDKIVRKLLQGAMANEENMVESGHIDMLSSMLIGDCESVEQIIAVWSDKFRWKEIKYKSINIGKIASQDVNFLRHSF
jgi:DNA repair exonuclease SbcCD ATPase subunit